MCDTLCAVRPAGTLFAKNSNRPSSEVQLIEALAVRPEGGSLRTQYLDLPDAGAYGVLGSRPDWLWGLEHGVNEHRVAIGNERVWTTLDPAKEPEALIGMDLVRLGLERGTTADEALDVMTSLLAEHGQGGVGNRATGESYFSSFIIADPTVAWVLETSGRTWVAAPVTETAAISNRLTIRDEWTRSSPDVAAGTDWDGFRPPNVLTTHADIRLAASRACLAVSPPADLTPAALAAHLRDHGEGPWGAPSEPDTVASPLPNGFSICWHARRFENTTSSMIAELPADPEAPLRAWVTPGNPCVGVFVPVFPPDAVPAALADPATWSAFATLRERVEADSAALAPIRKAVAPLEAELWAEADEVAPHQERHAAFVESAWRRVSGALTSLQAK
ncbi:MAG TPA: peptidase family C69 [Dehalococcoidia bacterium]